MNRRTEPKLITVVIPVRNRARLVEATLASVAAQSMAPARIVLVDNGSTDGTEEVLRRWADKRTDTIVVSEPIPGAAAARNRGLREVESPYVMFFDSDDIMPTRHIEEVSRGLHTCNMPPLAAFGAEMHTQSLINLSAPTRHLRRGGGG
ncbi:MAG: glycosyltransferase family 2 protein, partial [Muribaculaceae bacterium]|nr:glycosyltransferase family 2 protein [Muribaculaceae bacterium]